MTVSIYLDANALIEAVEHEEMAGLDFIRQQSLEGLRFITSELTWAEISIKPLKERDTALSDLYEELIFGGRLMTSIAVDRSVLRKSVEVRAWLGGKLPDTIHVASAIVTECRLVVSSDRRLRIPHGIERISLMDLMREKTAP
ncbi:type II toxin-antitoxin system VapC family toxin [Aureimonas psammosilenae]|uniref:type II toxin-antitoxin system VapC family toxin n=1 Tax=Aureimonas psammosilenae TaxID=2495496 RepID=UPI0018698472|nr:PIN domain-containing protein [Aureimonas psammosilenae]